MKRLICVLSCFVSATITASSDWTLLTGINGENTSDLAGYSVSLNSDGTIVAFGEEGYNSQSGRVKIFQNSGSTWNLLTGINGENAGDQAGWSVSLSADGTIVAFGEPAYNGQYGRVRIFQNNGSSWQLLTGINGVILGDQAGYSVSLSADGTIVAFGEPGFYLGSGRVRIFQNNGSSWQLLTGINGENPGYQAGYSVSLSSDGSRVAIGEPFYASAGRVRIFQNLGGTWTLLTGINGENIGDQAGYSVSLSADGSRVAIGEPFYDGVGNRSGRVRIFEYNGSTWNFLSEIDGENGDDQAGWSVSLNSDGSRIAIGENWYDGFGTDSGRVRILEYNGSTWNLMTGINGESGGDEAGYSVSINSDGSRVAFGEPYYSGGISVGLVRIYQGPANPENVESDCKPNNFMKILPFNLSEKTLPGDCLEKMVTYDYISCLAQPSEVASAD